MSSDVPSSSERVRLGIDALSLSRLGIGITFSMTSLPSNRRLNQSRQRLRRTREEQSGQSDAFLVGDLSQPTQ